MEKYWEAGLGSISLVCCGIGHDRPRSCEDRPAKCSLCAGLHKLEKHECGVSGCQAEWGKICAHVIATYGNCQGNYQAISTKCLIRQKAEREARKMKNKLKEGKSSQPEGPPAESERSSEDLEEENPDLDIDTDDGAGSPVSLLSSIEDPKSPDVASNW